MDTGQELLGAFILEHSTDAVEILEQLDITALVFFIESVSDDLAVPLILQIERYRAARCLEKIDRDKAIRIIDQLPGSIAQVLLRVMEQSLSKAILNGLPVKKKKALSSVLGYHQNKIGANIETDVCTVYIDMKVSEVLEKLKSTPLFVDRYLVVIGRNHELVGTADLRKLITTDHNTPIEHILSLTIPAVRADRDIQSLSDKDIWANEYSALPVIGPDSVFLGVIHKDVIRRKGIDEKSYDKHALNAAEALGELFRIGLTGLAQSAGEFDTKNISNQNS